MRHRFIAIALFALLVTPTYASPANAGGFEVPAGGGQRSLGRGGTGLARADDPLMGFLNPAALGSMPGQFIVGTEAFFLKGCVDLRGEFDPGNIPLNGEDQPGVALPEVCTGEDVGDRLTMLPLLGAAIRLHKRVGLLLGIDPPYSAREMQWTNATQPDRFGRDRQGWYANPPGIETDSGLIPAPTRYMLIDDNVVVLYPTIAIGAKVTDWLQIGAGFAWGFARVEFVNTTRFVNGGRQLIADQWTRARINDKFVPRFVGSLHFIPADSIDIVAAVRHDSTVNASGQTVAATPIGEARGPVDLEVPRPTWIAFGFRYADRIRPRAKLADTTGPSGATDDKMVNENWDIEANVIYEHNSTVDDLVFSTGELEVFADPGDQDPALTIAPFVLPIPHRWKDQFSIRVGGDWNVMPGQLALRLGASFETVGFNPGRGFIDYLPVQRYGINAGISGRFGGVEITLGYGFYAGKTFDDGGQTEQIVLSPDGVVEGAGDIMNDGAFDSTVHILGWSLRIIAD